MKTEWQKMVSGEEYQADDPEIIRVLNLTKDAVRAYNQIQPTRLEEREAAIRKIIGKCGEKPFFNQPFLCDYGVNIRVGDRFFANFNFTVLDEAYVPIGDNVWIGGNVTVLPGVTIGDNCTIGAGSVVTRDIPANSIAVGNPCRVIKKVDENHESNSNK